MELGTAIASGWASGINLYATVAILGLAGRFGWAPTPEALQSWWVIGVALALYAVEFVADKVPYVDNAWDAIHTFVRPAGAAVVAGLIAGEVGDVRSGVIAAVGAALGLSAHGAKATTRLAVNTSPEPFSNIAVSVAEDGIVFGMVALALAQPRLAAGLALVAAVLCVVAIVVLWGVARRAWRGVRARLADRR